MKVLCLFFLLMVGWTNSRGQAHEIAVLLLNVEKLSQYKAILSDLKTSYKVLSSGYSAIKDISEGNFTLHKHFLDGLMQVSPTVRNYRKVAWVIDYQIQLVKEYRDAYGDFKRSGEFKPDELVYLGQVYDNLFRLSLQNLDELLLVITAGNLRMSDDERLKAIDRIYLDMEDKVMFLRSFNNSTALLGAQREKERFQVESMKKIHGFDGESN